MMPQFAFMNTGWRTLMVSALFGINITILMGVALLAWTSKARLGAARQEHRALSELDRNLADLQRYVLEAETGQRGYLITGEESFLEPYRSARSATPEILAQLDAQLQAFPRLREPFLALPAKIAERDPELQNAIEIRRTGTLRMTQEAMRAGARRAGMDEIGSALDSLRESLVGELEVSGEKFQPTLNRVTLIMNLAAFFAMGTGILGVTLMLGSLREQSRTRELTREKRRLRKRIVKRANFSRA